MATDELAQTEFSCHFCDVCDGTGCIGEMPGMGGPNESRNFLLNCAGWDRIRNSDAFTPNKTNAQKPTIRLAPITGGVENIGYPDERQFYFDMVDACCAANVALSLGDGCPDTKLQYGIEAVQAAQQKYNTEIKAAVFIKPYPDNKILERFEWAKPVAEIVGIDIDSYNIVTMRNLVHLERKTPEQLLAIKAHLSKFGIPFAIKGIFNAIDIDMVKAVHPDIAFISNHGGRVDTRPGSTAEFLRIFHRTIGDNCGELWVDGGIRTAQDVETAATYGATNVLLGRPFITALCMNGNKAVAELASSLRN